MATDDKKYQVFVSSTYDDLREERQEVMHALLELDCIPSGMELFPAANEDQWSLIRGVIDDCDYYIVIIGGRYGSIGPQGLSYTEMEYRYAVESGKPVAAFLHGNPGIISASNTEKTDEGKQKLEAFRELVRKKICKNWTTAHELGSVVSRSLVALRKQHPGIGWVRGDKIASSSTATEILRLRSRIDELQAELAQSSTQVPIGAEKLAHGAEIFEVGVEYITWKDDVNYTWDHTVDLTWDDLFFAVGPLLMHEATTIAIRRRLEKEIERKVTAAFKEPDGASLDEDHKGHEIFGDITVSVTELETIIVQFAALGYIAHSAKSRSIKDRGDYWTLTPYGNTVMNQLRAVPAGGRAQVMSTSGTGNSESDPT